MSAGAPQDAGSSAPLAASPSPGELTGFGQLVGRSRRMRELFLRCEQVASTSDGVLLRGEAGTGKHTLARALHARSARAGRSLVVVDCSALVGTALEAELFGQEKAAAGPSSPRAGAFEQAEGGT